MNTSKTDATGQTASSANNNLNGGRSLTILPEDYRNEIFDQNLNYLKEHQPALFDAVEKHKCKDYRLCSNPDGSPNILHLASKTPVYAASSMDEIMAPIIHDIDSLFCYAHLSPAFFGEGDSWWKNNNPIQIKMLDGLYQAGMFRKLKLTSDNTSPLHNFCSDYLPLVRVYGIGLGYHITELIQRKKISYMTVFEPHLDLFYLSLYTIPWNLIFKYFESNNKGINLSLGTTPEQTIESNLAFTEQRLTPLSSLFYRFNHFRNLPAIQEVIEKEPQADSLQRSLFDAGWYEDQRIGFYFGVKNIKKGNKFYSGKKISRYFRVFIVGSGPSLNESIDYIKQHQNDAIIISCGSAITPLTRAGIIPDYQIIQERTWHIPKHEERHGHDLDTLKQVSLIKLNVVSTKIDNYYHETLVFQKYLDPGSSLLDDRYPVTQDVNPTVTNAGIVIAAELGANSAFLFGIDYGAPADSNEMHAQNTHHEDEGTEESVESQKVFELPGNLGSTIHTTSVLSWSLRITEIRIQKHKNIKWHNVGEGALIKGTTPISAENLPANFDKKIQKQRLREEITNCFNNDYSPTEALERLENFYLPQIEEYFQAIVEFTKSSPKSREEIVEVLSLMYEAASVGASNKDFLPASLLAHGIKQFINNVFIQTGLAPDDEYAVNFFTKSNEVLIEHLTDIAKDINRILSYIEQDDEPEIVNKW